MKYDSVLLVAFGGPTPGCCEKYNKDMHVPAKPTVLSKGLLGKLNLKENA